MFTLKIFRAVTLTVILTTYLSSTIAHAQPDQQSGRRQGPPPEAIAACADHAEGEACSFSGHRGDVTGFCFIPPHNRKVMACAPEGGPSGDRHRESAGGSPDIL